MLYHEIDNKRTKSYLKSLRRKLYRFYRKVKISWDIVSCCLKRVYLPGVTQFGSSMFVTNNIYVLRVRVLLPLPLPLSRQVHPQLQCSLQGRSFGRFACRICTTNPLTSNPHLQHATANPNHGHTSDP